MKYYDRLTGQMTASLPGQFDLGRFAVENDGVLRDLTNIDAAQSGEYVVREALLDSKFRHVHNLLYTIAENYRQSPVGVIPIIQKFNIEFNPFEDDLLEYLPHLHEIIRNPHSLLDKSTTKVNIGRAKRISIRSYQHLAHHSEDWEKMSILSPKPMKILHEELNVDFVVYENILLKAFLRKTIQYLRERIKETGDISKFFLSIFGARWVCPNCQYEFFNKSDVKLELPKNCPHCHQQVDWIEGINTIWGEKIDRRDKLVGQAMKSDKSKAAGTANNILSYIESELVKMEHSQLFDEFPRRIENTVTYHDTNVLNSHKHYKYLKLLWNELLKMRSKEDDKDPIMIYQEIIHNMRVYVESLFVYSLQQMGYVMSRKQGVMKFSHDSLPQMTIKTDKYGILHISTEKVMLKVVTLGDLFDKENIKEPSEDTICFCFYDFDDSNKTDNDGSFYFVSPMDTNSIECSGQVLREMIIREYVASVNTEFNFKHSLRDFLSAVVCKGIVFDRKSFTYSFSKELPDSLDGRQILDNLKEIPEFQKRNRRDQNSLLNDMEELIADINDNCSKIRKTLVCPRCGSQYRSRDIRYMVCDCGFICDVTDDGIRFFHQQKDGSLSNITAKGWGMDLVEQ